jgi:hypothetical protein
VLQIHTFAFQRTARRAKVEQKGSLVDYENSSEQRYSFGTITIKVGVGGQVEQREAMALSDHMLATAATISNVEALRMTNGHKNGSGFEQSCTTTSSFGEINVTVTIGFKLAHEVPLRALNTLVYGEMLPQLWKSVGIYFGRQKTPRQLSHRQVLHSIDTALGLDGVAAAGQRGERRQERRPALAR